MNMYWLDDDLELNARYHCNAHFKLILETAQMLCNISRKFGHIPPYKVSHQNHPCQLWIEESFQNWLWARNYAIALDKERMWRRQSNVPHKSIEVIKSLPIPDLLDKGITPFYQGVPKDLRAPDNPSKAYRDFFCRDRLYLAEWGRRGAPDWFLARGITQEQIEEAKRTHRERK